MAFQSLTIDLNANLQKLQSDLDRAQQISDQAYGRISKSASNAGQAIGDAANQADFGDLSKSASDAASSMDKLRGSTVGTGAAADQAKTKLQALFEEIDRRAGESFDNLEGKAKTAGVVAGIGVAAALAATAYVIEKTVAGTVSLALDVGTALAKFATDADAYKTKQIDSLIAANEKVKDLQVSLGITAQAASALELALARIGEPKGDFVSVYNATEKAVASNADAFNHLGIAYQDANGKALATQQVIQNAAKVLDSYTAGLDRNAAAAELGLGSADQVAKAARLNAGNFDDAAKRLQAYFLVIGPGSQAAIGAYEQAMREFRSESDLTSDGIKRAIADATIPILTELADFLKDGFPSAVGVVREVLTGLVTVFQGVELGAKALYEIVSFAFDSMDISVVASLRAIDKALHFDFTGARKEVDEGAKAIEARFQQLLDNTSRNLRQANANIDLAAGKDSQGATPQLTDKDRGKLYFGQIDFGKSDKDGKSSNVDVAKKLLEQQLKDLDTTIGQEKELLAGRDAFLELYYQADEVSLRDYYAARLVAQNEFLATARAGYAKEIEDAQAYIAATKADQSISPDQQQARVYEAETKLIDIREKLRKVEADATEQSIKDWFANRKAVEAYQDDLRALEAQIKSSTGDTAGAFAIDFDDQNRSRGKKLQAVLNSDSSTQDERNAARQGQLDLAQLREQGVAAAQLNDLTSQRTLVLDQLGSAQARINTAVSSGSKTELEGLAATSAANKARIADLQKIIDAQQAIAETIVDPFARSQALVSVDKMRVDMEQLGSQTDLVADKFRNLGESVTESFFEKLLNRTANLKTALKSLGADLVSQFAKIEAQEASQQLFKKGGVLSNLISGGFGSDSGVAANDASKSATSSTSANGLGGLLSKIFGSSGGSGGSANGSTGLSTLATTTSTLTAAFTSLNASVTQATAGLSSLTGSGGAAGLLGGGGEDSGDSSSGFNFAGLFTNGLSSLGASSSDGLSGESDGGGGGGSGIAGLSNAVNKLTPAMDALKRAADHAANSLNNVNSSGGSGGGGSGFGGLFSSEGGSGADAASDAGEYEDIFGSLLESAKGNAFSYGNVIPFARGGVISQKTVVPMAMMGEAGPEAIMPLKRGKNGVLGIASDSGVQQQGDSNASGASYHVNQTFVLNSPQSRQSQGQLLDATMRAINRRSRMRSA